MSLYQKLLTTSQPTFIVEGNEGFVDGVVEFIQKIIQKILDGLKWIWNFITGGGSSNKSTETLSKEVDKAVAELPKKMEEVNKQLDKAVAKAKNVSNKSKDTGRKIEEVLSNKRSGKISKDEMFTEFNKIMKGEDLEGEEKADTVKVVKEIEKEFTKVMNENGIKITSGARNEGAAIVIAAALQDKPLPKKSVDEMTGYVAASVSGLWFAKTKKVLGAQPVTIDTRKAQPIHLVNDSFKDGWGVLKEMVFSQIALLKGVTPLTHGFKGITQGEIELFHKDLLSKKYSINDEVTFLFQKESETSDVIKIKMEKNKIDFDGVYLGVNYETFKLINKWMDVLSGYFKEYENEVSRVLKLMEKEKASIEVVGEKEVLALYLKLTNEKIDISGKVMNFVKHYIDSSAEFGAAPMAWLE